MKVIQFKKRENTKREKLLIFPKIPKRYVKWEIISSSSQHIDWRGQWPNLGRIKVCSAPSPYIAVAYQIILSTSNPAYFPRIKETLSVFASALT